MMRDSDLVTMDHLMMREAQKYRVINNCWATSLPLLCMINLALLRASGTSRELAVAIPAHHGLRLAGAE